MCSYDMANWQREGGMVYEQMKRKQNKKNSDSGSSSSSKHYTIASYSCLFKLDRTTFWQTNSELNGISHMVMLLNAYEKWKLACLYAGKLKAFGYKRETTNSEKVAMGQEPKPAKQQHQQKHQI